MEKPMKILQKFLDLFLEEGYVETNDKNKAEGIVIDLEEYQKINDYLSYVNSFLKQVQEDNKSLSDTYSNSIDEINKQIEEINRRIKNIQIGNKNINTTEIMNILNQIVMQISKDADLEVGEFKKINNSKGKTIGGEHASVLDSSRNNKKIGGIIKSSTDRSDYTGKYKKIDDILAFLTTKIKEIEQELNKQSNNNIDVPYISKISETLSQNGKQKIELNNNIDGVKVKSKNFLRKRTVAILLALGLSAAALIANLRGKIINISGAHGNEPQVSYISENFEEEIDYFDEISRRYGIDIQETTEEKKTLGEYDENFDANLLGEENSLEYTKIKEEFQRKKREIDEQYKNIKNPTNEQFLEYQKEIELLLLEIYGYESDILVEDNKVLREGIEANNEHINVSEGIQEPKENQHGLVGSLDNEDIERHEKQNEEKQKTIEKNEEKIKIIQDKTNELENKIEFTDKLKESKLLDDLDKELYENVYESVYQMYKNHSSELSIDEFFAKLKEKDIDLVILAEYAKEENENLSMDETLEMYSLIQNSLEVYMQEYDLNKEDINISSYVQYVNQFIEDNPELGKDGSVFDILRGEFLQNDMNSSFYSNRQDGGKKEGVFSTIIRNIKTLFDKERREEYEKRVKSFSEMVEQKNKSDHTR